MDIRELRHITVESGREMICERDQVVSSVIALPSPRLAKAIESCGHVDIPGSCWIPAQVLKDGKL